MTPAVPDAGQVWDCGSYAQNAGFVADLGAPVLDLLDPRPGERILDLGCGDGRLTAKLAASGAEVIGLEPDPSMTGAARSRGLTVLSQDAHDAFGEAEFDAVFSNAVLHWMKKPEAVFANVHAALKPGGRFVAEQGGFGNCAAFVTAIRDALEARGREVEFAWDFPSTTVQRRRLEEAGFRVEEMALVPRPTPLPTGMEGWLEVFAGPYLRGLSPQEAEAVKRDTVRRLKPALHDEVEGWIADYVRLRFRALRA